VGAREPAGGSAGLGNVVKKAGQYAARVHSRTEIATFLPHWQALADNAAEENV
jgi:hypothetical protein